MNKTKEKKQNLLVWVAIGGLALVGGWGIYALTSAFTPKTDTSVAATEGAPLLNIAPETVDLGTIDASKGLVTTYYTVENRGAGDLVINEMETSCGCTSAVLIVNGKEGPRFGMRGHGNWPTGWSARLRPSEKAELKVIYDPNAHGFYEGPVERLVILYSNDPKTPEKQIRFTGNQIGGQGK